MKPSTPRSPSTPRPHELVVLPDHKGAVATGKAIPTRARIRYLGPAQIHTLRTGRAIEHNGHAAPERSRRRPDRRLLDRRRQQTTAMCVEPWRPSLDISSDSVKVDSRCACRSEGSRC